MNKTTNPILISVIVTRSMTTARINHILTSVGSADSEHDVAASSSTLNKSDWMDSVEIWGTCADSDATVLSTPTACGMAFHPINCQAGATLREVIATALLNARGSYVWMVDALDRAMIPLLQQAVSEVREMAAPPESLPLWVIDPAKINTVAVPGSLIADRAQKSAWKTIASAKAFRWLESGRLGLVTNQVMVATESLRLGLAVKDCAVTSVAELLTTAMQQGPRSVIPLNRLDSLAIPSEAVAGADAKDSSAESNRDGINFESRSPGLLRRVNCFAKRCRFALELLHTGSADAAALSEQVLLLWAEFDRRTRSVVERRNHDGIQDRLRRALLSRVLSSSIDEFYLIQEAASENVATRFQLQLARMGLRPAPQKHSVSAAVQDAQKKGYQKLLVVWDHLSLAGCDLKSICETLPSRLAVDSKLTLQHAGLPLARIVSEDEFAGLLTQFSDQGSPSDSTASTCVLPSASKPPGDRSAVVDNVDDLRCLPHETRLAEKGEATTAISPIAESNTSTIDGHSNQRLSATLVVRGWNNVNLGLSSGNNVQPFDANWLTHTADGFRPLHSPECQQALSRCGEHPSSNRRLWPAVFRLAQDLETDLLVVVSAQRHWTVFEIFKAVKRLLGEGRTAGYGLNLFLGGAAGHSKTQYDYLWGSPLSSFLAPVFSAERDDSKETVSIVLTTYRRPEGLRLALQSCLAQEHPAAEIIVVDDNDPTSEAGIETRQLMREFCDQQQVRYVRHHRNRNGSAARNTGLFLARSKYVCFLDDDDLYLPNRLSAALKVFREQGEGIRATVVGHRSNESEAYNAFRFREGDLTREILGIEYASHYLNTNTGTYERAALLRLNGYDESFRRHQDLELNLRFFERYRIGGSSEMSVWIRPNPRLESTALDGPRLIVVKERFLARFQHLINRLPAVDQEQIYAKNWGEVTNYFRGVDNFAEYYRTNRPGLAGAGLVNLLLKKVERLEAQRELAEVRATEHRIRSEMLRLLFDGTTSADNSADRNEGEGGSSLIAQLSPARRSTGRLLTVARQLVSPNLCSPAVLGLTDLADCGPAVLVKFVDQGSSLLRSVASETSCHRKPVTRKTGLGIEILEWMPQKMIAVTLNDPTVRQGKVIGLVVKTAAHTVPIEVFVGAKSLILEDQYRETLRAGDSYHVVKFGEIPATRQHGVRVGFQVASGFESGDVTLVLAALVVSC